MPCVYKLFKLKSAISATTGCWKILYRDALPLLSPGITLSCYLYVCTKKYQTWEYWRVKKGSFCNSLESFDKRFRGKSHRGLYYRTATCRRDTNTKISGWEFVPRYGLFKLHFGPQVTRNDGLRAITIRPWPRRRVSAGINCRNSGARNCARTERRKAQ